MTTLILDTPYIEPPTKEQWQQMREDYEDWLKAFAAEPLTRQLQAMYPETSTLADKKPGI